MIDDLVQELSPRRPRVDPDIPQRRASSLVGNEQKVEVFICRLDRGAAAGAAFAVGAVHAAFTARGSSTAAAGRAGRTRVSRSVTTPCALVEEKASDVEARLGRPAHLMQRESAEVIAACQGSSVVQKEAKHIHVASSTRNVHHRLSELVAGVLQMKRNVGERKEKLSKTKRRPLRKTMVHVGSALKYKLQEWMERIDRARESARDCDTESETSSK